MNEEKDWELYDIIIKRKMGYAAPNVEKAIEYAEDYKNDDREYTETIIIMRVK